MEDDFSAAEAALFSDYALYVSTYLRECLPSVLAQALSSSLRGLLLSVLVTALCSAVHTFTKSCIVKDILISTLCTVSGAYLLLNSYESGAWNVLLFAGMSVCTICVIKPQPRLMGTASLCILFLVFNELFVDHKKWHSIRGSLMILLMKIISVSIDIDNGLLKEVSILRLSGYLMAPCSVVYGPWIHYRSYCLWWNEPRLSFQSLKRGTKTYLFSLTFLLYSTCFSQLIFSNIPSNKWIRAYQDAQSFRFSHYFISYLSLSYLNAANVDLHVDSMYKEKSIVDPWSIELPRSLIDVVTLWNLPMHFWLKTYIFSPCRRYGRFVAIIFTFMISSLLHGFNFALSAILISLGFLSYIEYVIRSQMAKLLSACIKSRACSNNCEHTRKAGHVLTRFVNLFFTLLNMFHLAYIAAMFDSSDEQTEGYSMSHTLSSWKRLHYSGHVTAFITYLLYLGLKALF